MYYQKRKRERIDHCNICGNILELTWDHVPPQKCYNDSKVEYNTFFHDAAQANDKYLISQNGIKFRSLCGKCNNGLLGSKYDPVLEGLTNYINSLFTSKISLPSIVKVPIKVNKLSRSIVGHILAAKNEYDEESLIDKALRDYFEDTSALPPENVRLLFRVYPFNEIMIVRDLGVKNTLPRYGEIPDGVISCLYFYPIAFILNYHGDLTCGQLDLFSISSEDIEDIVDLHVDLLSYKYPNSDRIRHPLWPCHISDDEDGTCLAIVTDNIDYSVITQKRKG